MRLSVAHTMNELYHSCEMGFREDTLWLWTMTSKWYISMSGIEDYPYFSIRVGITTKHHTLVYENKISVRSSGNMLKNLCLCIQADPNVFLAMKAGLRYRWYLKSEEGKREEENERRQRLDEIVDCLLH